MTIILLISFLWAFIEGRREAMYFHCKWNTPYPIDVKDEHFEFTLQRSLYAIVSGAVGVLIYGTPGLIAVPLIMFSFSYFHNGGYYLMRNKLDSNIYKLGWKDSSDTTTAKLSLDYRDRLNMLVFSLAVSVSFDLLNLFTL
jgi:hypothetical protein